MDRNVIVLKKSDKSIFFKELEGIEKYYSCSNKNILFRIFLKFKLPLSSFFLGKWKKNIKKYSTVILFDDGYNKKIAKYIKNKNKKTRIIFWYWNSLNEYNNAIIEDKNIDEIWTYNRFDAERNNLNYNTQFYYMKEQFPDNKTVNDVVFMGRDKGREKSIEEIEKNLKEYGLSCNFNIIKSEKDYINYEKYLELVSKSKCILDYSYIDYNGLSLRPMEALFYQKKLITNNKDIVNYDFYNPNNIFVLGIDDINKVKEFINRPYQKIDEKIVNYYDYESWLKRFGI